MSEGYSVVFSGELLEGFEPERVRAGLVKVFEIAEEQAEAILSGGRRVVKRGLSDERAERYLEVLGRLGMVVSKMAPGDAEPTGPSPAVEDSAAPPATSATPAATEEGPAEHPFRFSGRAGEYFRIWIVNVLLTIVTLGVYSAWAKVRNNRYFYGNTRVAGGSFEYLAEPLAILKGRIIAVALFLIYAFASNTQSLLSLVALLALGVVMPWLIARSLAFRNRNTALRNIRFGFDGGYGGAAKAFVLWPLAGALTLGLLLPMAIREQDRYVVGNARYGTTPFEFAPSLKAYFKIFGGVVLIFIGGMVGVMAITLLFGAGMAPAAVGPDSLGSPLMGLASMITALSILLVYLYAFAYFAALRNNLVYNGSRLADHGFSATMSPARLAWIQISNWAVTIATLGLARPWAKIRLARYKAECLTLVAGGGLDAFTAAEEVRVSAMGEEMGEAFDFDIGL